MRKSIPFYYSREQLEDRNIQMSIQWWSEDARMALYALHDEEERTYRRILRKAEQLRAMRLELERQEKTFNPAQPRVPAGEPYGGQWVGSTDDEPSGGDDSDDGGDSGSSDDESGTPPANVQTVTDPTGDMPWSSRIDSSNAAGDLLGQTFLNRDGSLIIATYNPTGSLSFDNRIIIRNPDGSAYAFTNIGNTQTLTDARTGEVFSRTQMTVQCPVALAVPEQVPHVTPVNLVVPAPPPVMLGLAALTAAATYYQWLGSAPSAFPSFPGAGTDDAGIPFLSMSRVREYDGANPDKAISTAVGAMSVRQARQNCPAYDRIQAWTNEAGDVLPQAFQFASPQAYGIAVHKYVEQQVMASGDPTLTAEPKLSSTDGGGILGYIRPNIIETVGNGTVCIYDIKTGVAGLPSSRADDFAARIKSFHRALTAPLLSP